MYNSISPACTQSYLYNVINKLSSIDASICRYDIHRQAHIINIILRRLNIIISADFYLVVIAIS